MTTKQTPAKKLTESVPSELISALERQTGHTVSSIKTRSGGGASREGAELELRNAAGETYRAYLSFDTRRNSDARRKIHFRREVAVLAALSGEWASSGVCVARYLGSDERYLAILCELVEGEVDFNKLRDEQERQSTVEDFMSQLAALHSIDISSVELDGFQRQANFKEVVNTQIQSLRKEHLQKSPQADPLYLLALNWLEKNIPAPPERQVLVHGDAGPANFLFKDGRVTAHLDWELVRYGDPMEDMAMLCIRNLFQPFAPLPDAFSFYEGAGGTAFDLDKVRYFRLYNQVSFMASSSAAMTSMEAPDPPVFGMNLVFNAAHRRVMAISLLELTGATVDEPEIPEVPESIRMKSFEVALKDLRNVIVPQISDQLAASKAKGLARLVKWWRQCDRYGAVFEQIELTEISFALGCHYDDISVAHAALNDAILSGSLDHDTAMQLCYSQVQRDLFLQSDAMGAFAQVSYADLE